MTSDQLKNVILEAVDCLRLRKCRPDRESIAVYVMRKLGSSMNEIFSEIENTVDQGLLLKVEYKGSTSYRSPKSFDVKNSPLLTKHSKILNSSKTTRYVMSGMNELLSSFPTYSQAGVPYEELKKKLQEFDKERFADEGIKVIFEREEAGGNIQVAQSDDPRDPVRLFPKDIKVPEDMKLISLCEEVAVPPENKKKKRPKKDEDSGGGGGTGSGTSIPKSPSASTKKRKPALVYAVKSDPHKVQDASLEDEEVVRATAKQINSIGLKVIAEKTALKKNMPIAKPKVKNGVSVPEKSEVGKISSDANKFDRKPSLGLVKVETEQEKNGPSQVNSCAEKAQRSPIKGKRKNEVELSQKVNKASKLKKAKIEPAHELVTFIRKPPRYTYGSKKRAKDEDYEDVDEALDNQTNNAAADSTTEPTSNGLLGECAYCKQEKNLAGDCEDFLLCGTCNVKVHATCIAYSEDHAKRLRVLSDSKDLQWQCFACKKCGVCQKGLMSSKNGSELKKGKGKISKKNEQQRYILCDSCDRGYHVKCVNDSFPLNESSWYCGECSSNKVDTTNDNPPAKVKDVVWKKSKALINNKKPTKPAGEKKKVGQSQSDTNEKALMQAKTQNGSSSSSQRSTSINVPKSQEEVPDISTWTPTQVQKYFTDNGLPDEAATLREQEIDGMSLLLLRRADVIFGLNLRLGPALKIYRLVCDLQQHSSALKKKTSSSENTQQSKKC